MAELCLNEHNKVFASKWSGIRAQAVYVLHSTMHSVTCYDCVMSALSAAFGVTYFQFPIQSAFLSYVGRQAAPVLRRIGFTLIRNIGHRTLPKIWVGTFCIERTILETTLN